MNNEPAADENPGGFFAHAWCVVRQAHHEGEGLAAKLVGTCSLRQSSRNWPPAILHRPHGELVEPRRNGSSIHLFKKILPTYPTHQNIPYPTPRPFRRECFRKLSKVGKGSALRPVGEPLGRGGSVQSCDVGQGRLPGRVVQGIATTATPTKDFSAPDGPPVFPTFSTARRESGRGNGPPHCKQSLRRYGRIDQTHGVIAFPRRRTVHGGNLAALLVDDHRHRQAERQVLALELIEHAHGRIAVERQ